MVRNVRIISFLQETQGGPSDLDLGQTNSLAVRPKFLGQRLEKILNVLILTPTVSTLNCQWAEAKRSFLITNSALVIQNYSSGQRWCLGWPLLPRWMPTVVLLVKEKLQVSPASVPPIRGRMKPILVGLSMVVQGARRWEAKVSPCLPKTCFNVKSESAT